MMTTREYLESLTVAELKAKLKLCGIKGISRLRKDKLVNILQYYYFGQHIDAAREAFSHHSIKMVPITTLMQKLTSSADRYYLADSESEWFRMFACKLKDPQVPAIIRAIEEYGFTDPICVTESPSGDWELGNGHHRLCIAILLGLDEIPVDFSNWYSSRSTQNSDRIQQYYRDGDYLLADWIAQNAVPEQYAYL